LIRNTLSQFAAAAVLLAVASTTVTARAAPPGFGEALRQRIELLRAASDPQIGAGSAGARNVIAALYEQRGFTPLWNDPQRTRALRAAISASTSHGLDPRDYHADALDAADVQARNDGAPPPDLVQRELLYTDAFMRLAYHLRFGKADPRALAGGWNFARTLDGVDPVEALSQLIQAPDPAAALEALAPQLDAYRQLRAALRALRATEQAGGWPKIDPGAKLEPGVTDVRVTQLRARLAAGGDLSESSSGGETFDDELAQAVRRFQVRHGLEPDGVVGGATLAALNVTVAERIDQVRANLERLRWVARELSGDFLLVDIAGYTAQLWLDNRPAWSARVVVGQPYRTTPVFSAPMKYLVLNPEWHVPPTILREDVLPKVIADPGYLQHHNMRVLDARGQSIAPESVDWASYKRRPAAFPYQIVQMPGGDNPLGRIKFMFPNDHAVYLHDTASPRLFERTVRAFSSGCIRVENPIALAALLLDDPQRWSADRLREAIAAGRTQTLPVRRQVPVLLLYFTAVVGSDGKLQFRPDLYGRDAAIIRALAAPFRFAPVDTAARPVAAKP
jgi:murein L,D-transpeptidase YcbB/YkuD